MNIYAVKGLTEKDDKAILDHNKKGIEMTIDEYGRVFNEGGIYIADAKEVEPGFGVGCWGKGGIAITTIMLLDEQGEISELAVYTLPAKEALIAYRQQNVFKNGNTWTYPSEDPAIREMRGGEYCYFKGDANIFTKSEGGR